MEIIRPIFSPSPDVPNQYAFNFPKRLGGGTIRFDRFSSGLVLLYMDVSPTEPVGLNFEIAGCGVSFNIKGYSEVRSTDHKQILLSNSDTSVHYVYPYPQILEEDITTRRKVKVSILFDKNTLLDFAHEDEEPFLPFLKGFQNQVPVSGQGKIAPEIQQALNQLIECPYRGRTRTIFLEGKTMELFASKLEQMRVKGKSISRLPRINASDTERIRYAAELLLRDPLNPPDLTDLARKVGMGRSKFYQNFKIVFGHSPMGHLHSHRLLTARELLRQGKHNVTEVAFTVGFNNLSYFAKTFNAEFGLSPHQVI